MADAAGGATHRDDRSLLAAHVAGDPDAFGVLFRRHRDRLWAVALRTLGDPEEAADALQDAMVSAFRRAGSFRGDAAVTTWLHRVVVNACLDRARRRQVRTVGPLPEEAEQGGGGGGGPGSGTVSLPGGGYGVTDPADLVLDQERRDVVLHALASLPFEQRAALVLIDMEGRSVEEAAAILDCAPGTVKSRCSRGRARLAPLLAALRPGPAGPDREPDADVPRPSTGPTGGGGEPR